MSPEVKGTAFNNTSSNTYKGTWRYKPEDSTHFSNVSDPMGRDLKLDNEAIFSGSWNNFVNTYVNSNVFIFILFIHYNIIFVLLVYVFYFTPIIICDSWSRERKLLTWGELWLKRIEKRCFSHSREDLGCRLCTCKDINNIIYVKIYLRQTVTSLDETRNDEFDGNCSEPDSSGFKARTLRCTFRGAEQCLQQLGLKSWEEENTWQTSM
jgi:hypothetical protein